MAEILLSPGRYLVGALVLLGGLQLLSEGLTSRRMPYSRGMGVAMRSPMLWVPWLIPGALFVMATLAWVTGFYPFVSGLSVLAVVLWWRRVGQRDWPEGEVKRLGQYSPAAGVVLVLLCGRAAHVFLGVGGPDLGWHLAAGVLAYSWTICGVNKLRQSGMAWAGSENMALLLAERSTLGPLIQIRLRRWLMNQPGWLRFLGWSSLGFELSGVLFCIPELRLGFSIGVVVFFGLNFLVWGFIELEWALIFLAVALGGS